MIAAWAAIAAAPIAGSLLGLLIVRLPAGEGVVLGRSRCRRCGHALGPLDLVPLLGWIARGGRCRYCTQPISRLYPLVELAAIGVAAWAAATVPAAAVWASALLGWTLLGLAVIDARDLILPDALTLPLAAGGLVAAAFLDRAALPDHAAGAAAGWLGFWLVGEAYARLRHRQGLGGGDAKLMAAAGAWVGWQGLASVVLLGALGALAAVAAAAVAGRPVTATSRIPFGPFLAAGLWLTWLYGPVDLALVAAGS